LHAVFQSTYLNVALTKSCRRCELSQMGHQLGFLRFPDRILASTAITAYDSLHWTNIHVFLFAPREQYSPI
jgi:hypothetical protein